MGHQHGSSITSSRLVRRVAAYVACLISHMVLEVVYGVYGGLCGVLGRRQGEGPLHGVETPRSRRPRHKKAPMPLQVLQVSISQAAFRQTPVQDCTVSNRTVPSCLLWGLGLCQHLVCNASCRSASVTAWHSCPRRYGGDLLPLLQQSSRCKPTPLLSYPLQSALFPCL